MQDQELAFGGPLERLRDQLAGRDPGGHHDAIFARERPRNTEVRGDGDQSSLVELIEEVADRNELRLVAARVRRTALCSVTTMVPGAANKLFWERSTHEPGGMGSRTRRTHAERCL